MLIPRTLVLVATGFALFPLACRSNASGPQEIAITPRLDPNVTLESQKTAEKPPTTPGRAYATPSAAPMDELGFSAVLVPQSAHDDPRRPRFVKRGRTYVAKVGSGKDAFTWNIDAAPTSYFDLVTIEDGNAVVHPLHNGGVPGAGKAPVVESIDNRGEELIFHYADLITQTFKPVGRSLSIEVARDPSPRRGRLELDLGGLLVEKGGGPARVFCVPYFDIASVAAVDLKREGMRYLTAWFDFQESNASLIQAQYPGERGPDGELRFGQHARYLNATDGMRRQINERIWVTWGTELDQVLPSMDRPAAPERAQLGNYYYVSFNATPFSEARDELQQLAGLGVKDAQIWMHQWQKDGYDTGYPNDVMPPRREWGGLEGLQAVCATAAAAGFGFALHHNWIFNTIGLPGKSLIGGDGLEVGGRGVNGILRPSAAVELVDSVEGELHSTFQTRGTFTDSLTASLPMPDFDRKREGWGLMSKSLDDLGKVMVRLRAIHGAPTAGEGSLGFGTIAWSGLADVMPGSVYIKAQPPALDRCSHYMEIVPHFALGPLHDLSVRAGIGPPTRFTLPERPTMAQSFTPQQRDQTQTLAALYGNAAYHWWYQLTIPGTCARDWWSSSALLVELARPGRVVLSIRYVDERQRELDLNDWIAAGFDLTEGSVRLHLTWKGGDELWANLTNEPWTPKARKEPIAPMGYLAEVAGIKAAILSTATGVVQTLESPTRRYLDARGTTTTAMGITTDGAAGMERVPDSEGGGWQVYPIPVYTLAMPASAREQQVTCHELTLSPDLWEEGPPTLTWLDDRNQPTKTETRPSGPLELQMSDFESNGASSLRITRAE